MPDVAAAGRAVEIAAAMLRIPRVAMAASFDRPLRRRTGSSTPLLAHSRAMSLVMQRGNGAQLVSTSTRVNHGLSSRCHAGVATLASLRRVQVRLLGD